MSAEFLTVKLPLPYSHVVTLGIFLIITKQTGSSKTPIKKKNFIFYTKPLYWSPVIISVLGCKG